ncbi:unnamed protein product, partial [Nippostrongylus brasiliensis]|uniref:30S ribosomal protein S21 n=1 Tax=Nippostrongylus brasiliensis TaxID=27835 RepID=A0A0N4YRG0_NIPBR
MDSYFLSKLQNRDEMFLKRLSKHIRPGLHIGEMVHHSKPSRRFRKRGYRRFLRRRMRVAGDANVGRSE